MKMSRTRRTAVARMVKRSTTHSPTGPQALVLESLYREYLDFLGDMRNQSPAYVRSHLLKEVTGDTFARRLCICLLEWGPCGYAAEAADAADAGKPPPALRSPPAKFRLKLTPPTLVYQLKECQRYLASYMRDWIIHVEIEELLLARIRVLVVDLLIVQARREDAEREGEDMPPPPPLPPCAWIAVVAFLRSARE